MQKNSLAPVRIAASQSLASSFTSPATMIKNLDNVAYQINVTTTNSIGTFAVQVSLDYVPSNDIGGPGTSGNWATLTLSGTPSVSAANDVITLNLNQLPATAVRLAYTSSTAGTGTCDIYVAAKSVS